MATQGVSGIDLPSLSSSGPTGTLPKSAQSFKASLDAAQSRRSVNPTKGAGGRTLPPMAIGSLASRAGTVSSKAAVDAYNKQVAAAMDPPAVTDWEKYKDDQLLRNPGGREYYLGEKKVVHGDPAQKSFTKRLSKDLSDSFSNFKNFFGNLLMGTQTCYRDENNNIKTAKQRGMLGALGDFCKDLGSAFTFGAYRPEKSEKAPQGFLGRMGYSLSKIKDAFMGDLAGGVTSSLNHAGRSLALAGWSFLEAAPDATIGNLPLGRQLTTKVFDNGHVFVEYVTDVIPSGDAWLRVHAWQYKGLKLPVLYNIKMPERYADDARWAQVRNTPFRKTVETLGSLLADAAAEIFLPSAAMSMPDDKHALEKF